MAYGASRAGAGVVTTVMAGKRLKCGMGKGE
jgi:hypothetical protein